MNFFCYEIVSYLYDILSGFVWNTNIMFGLVLLTATWIY